MELTANIKDWRAWCPAAVTVEQWRTLLSTPATIDLDAALSPDVKAIPAMLRRRLNTMGKAAASTLLPLIQQANNPAIVYCSRHGEIRRTESVLQDIITDTPVSPTSFSLAVHNAMCGVLSINQKLTSNITATAAGDEPVVPTLLEAIGLLHSGTTQVICVWCDDIVPSAYTNYTQQPPIPYVVSVLLQLQSDDAMAAISLKSLGVCNEPSNSPPENSINPPLMPQAFSLLEQLLLDKTTPSDVNHCRQHWQLRTTPLKS